MTRLTLTCQALLFDLDGVLVDSRAVVERTWQRWAEHRGVLTRDIARAAHGRRSIETIREFAPDLDPSSEAQWLEALEVGDVEGLTALAGAADAYNALPDARRAVVTSAGRELATTRLRATGFSLPAVLVVAEDVLEGKPAPDAYLLAAVRLGFASSDCLVIEDAPAGIAAGKAAGSVVLGVTTTFPESDLTAANLIVRSLAALSVSVDGAFVRVEIAF